MKILLSNKFFYPRGGDCIHTIQLKKLLEQKGHQVAVFSMDFPENLESIYSEYWPSEVSFENKKPKKLISALKRPFGVLEVSEKWNRLLNEFEPDIVHLHNIHSQLSPIIAEESKKQNIPVVWTLHDYKLLCPTYTFMDNTGNVCEDCLKKPKSVITKKCIKESLLPSVLGYLELKKWNKNKLQQITHKFISPSRFLKSKMMEGGFHSEQIEHIFNFADNEKFNNIVKSKRKNQIIYLGRLSKEKGVETLCKAFNNKQNVKLKIIGDGALRLNLQKKYASSTIEFLGFKSWDFIKEELGNSKFLVIPSEWYENNPLTIIEALALGTPVLGAGIGGIPELITQKKNGLIFKSGNHQDLSERIEEMISIKDWDYKNIQIEAKKSFSEEIYYNKLMKVYSTI